ncbi:small, acid-soluble spore protein L [Siminovitchia sp. FSL H7-0308]|uniref:Small, acid-soluble spore protein L n=1 Tax=Siminovitchia thermophila TaxID=1245522 RepID=A0ABS2R7W9_9BACI|nr:small, acid-soluble spore protein L [Siminovitchia thermophila]MBM7715751.1 small acid-soluble spore protein L (minor) [Siminovitchia thermophila]ONK23584.1 small, acid-soluble spore protein L [Bacillus sp. VT-16-64]
MNRRDPIKNEKRVVTSVNPQGYSEDKANQAPKTKLEERSKKSNTKM